MGGRSSRESNSRLRQLEIDTRHKRKFGLGHAFTARRKPDLSSRGTCRPGVGKEGNWEWFAGICITHLLRSDARATPCFFRRRKLALAYFVTPQQTDYCDGGCTCAFKRWTVPFLQAISETDGSICAASPCLMRHSSTLVLNISMFIDRPTCYSGQSVHGIPLNYQQPCRRRAWAFG